jgi:hypothetical protein
MKTKEEIKDIVWELDNCPKKAQRIKIIENLLKEETEELKAEIKELMPYLIRLKAMLLSGDSYCFDNEWDYKDGEELEKLLSKTNN